MQIRKFANIALTLLLCLVTGVVSANVVTIDPRDPFTYSWQTYTWVLVLSLWGGLVAHVRKYAENNVPANRIAAFIVDIAGSGLVGILVFFGCESVGVTGPAAVLAVGVSGHMGVKALFALEKRCMPFITKLKDHTTRSGSL
jgi:peptidoglycan/LPS O-acetylase OafA/YrhL